MTPDEIALSLQEEIELTLTELASGNARASVFVLPPPELTPGSHFTISVETPDAAPVVRELSTNLALGYLADEEAAVDEWRLWLVPIVECLTLQADPPHGADRY